MIRDQGCPLGAGTTDFLVNSEGELVRGGKHVACSMLNLSDQARREELSRREYNFARRVFACQECVDFGRFRVYGALRNGRRRIVVVTEFCWWCDDAPFWQGLKDKARRLRAHLWIMSERPHLDRYAPPRGIEGEKILATMTEEGQRWATGPNHGRKERQVELSWRIERLFHAELRRLVGRLKRATQPLWERAGVGVC